MKRFINRKVLVAGLIAGLTFGGAGAAFAYFTSTGSGTGSASTGASAPVSITQTNTVSGLLPGAAAQTINYKVTNGTSSAEYVGQVTVSISSISGAGTNGSIETCAPSLYTLTQGAALNTDLAAGGTATGTATIALPDDGHNQNNCAGATVNLAFSSN